MVCHNLHTRRYLTLHCIYVLEVCQGYNNQVQMPQYYRCFCLRPNDSVSLKSLLVLEYECCAGRLNGFCNETDRRSLSLRRSPFISSLSTNPSPVQDLAQFFILPVVRLTRASDFCRADNFSSASSSSEALMASSLFSSGTSLQRHSCFEPIFWVALCAIVSPTIFDLIISARFPSSPRDPVTMRIFSISNLSNISSRTTFLRYLDTCVKSREYTRKVYILC
jgi:hypothetical protein